MEVYSKHLRLCKILQNIYFTLHIYSKSCGNCDEEIINLIDKAIDLLQSSGISIKAVASDGDPGYNEKARETFAQYITILKNKDSWKLLKV